MEERINRQQEAFREAADPALPVAQNLAMILRSIFTLDREEPPWSALFMISPLTPRGTRRSAISMRACTAVGAISAWRRSTANARPVWSGTTSMSNSALQSSSPSSRGTMMQSRLAPDSSDLDATEPLSRLLAEWLEPHAKPSR